MTHVTDTHPLIWYLSRNPRLSETARIALSDPAVQIVVPTISLVEIKFLHSRRRISIDLAAALAHVASTTNCSIAELDEAVVEHCPSTLDIHDAIIVGTALMYRDVLGESVALITRDTEITNSGLVPVIW